MCVLTRMCTYKMSKKFTSGSYISICYLERATARPKDWHKRHLNYTHRPSNILVCFVFTHLLQTEKLSPRSVLVSFCRRGD